MNKKSLGERIQKIRGDLSREAFAAQLGVAPLTIFKYEKGKRTPDADFLNKVVEVFNCDPAWLLTGKEPAPAQVVPLYPPDLQSIIDRLVYISGDPDSKMIMFGKIVEEYVRLKAIEKLTSPESAGEKGGKIA